MNIIEKLQMPMNAYEFRLISISMTLEEWIALYLVIIFAVFVLVVWFILQWLCPKLLYGFDNILEFGAFMFIVFVCIPLIIAFIAYAYSCSLAIGICTNIGLPIFLDFLFGFSGIRWIVGKIRKHHENPNR